MIVQITQELIDRMQHTETECDTIPPGTRQHFPCLTEVALEAALGWPVNVAGDYSDYTIYDSRYYDRAIGHLDAAGQAIQQAYDHHQPLEPTEFEILP